jgi:hypothetical protein
MKKVLMLIAVILGTSVMVSAKTTTTKSVEAKEVSTSKHHKNKAEKKEAKAEKKAAKEQKNAEAATAKK